MATQAQRRRWRDAVEATPTARDWAERSGRPRLEVRRGIPAAADRARPLEFDARGFRSPSPPRASCGAWHACSTTSKRNEPRISAPRAPRLAFSILRRRPERPARGAPRAARLKRSRRRAAARASRHRRHGTGHQQRKARPLGTSAADRAAGLGTAKAPADRGNRRRRRLRPDSNQTRHRATCGRLGTPARGRSHRPLGGRSKPQHTRLVRVRHSPQTRTRGELTREKGGTNRAVRLAECPDPAALGRPGCSVRRR